MVVGSHDGFIIENAEHDCYHLSDWCVRFAFFMDCALCSCSHLHGVL